MTLVLEFCLALQCREKTRKLSKNNYSEIN